MESSSIRLKIEASKFLCRCTILSNDLVQLLSVIAEVLLFGIFCVLYPISVWILVRRQHRGRYALVDRNRHHHVSLCVHGAPVLLIRDSWSSEQSCNAVSRS